MKVEIDEREQKDVLLAHIRSGITWSGMALQEFKDMENRIQKEDYNFNDLEKYMDSMKAQLMNIKRWYKIIQEGIDPWQKE